MKLLGRVVPPGSASIAKTSRSWSGCWVAAARHRVNGLGALVPRVDKVLASGR